MNAEHATTVPSEEPPGWSDPCTTQFMLEEYRAYREALVENEKSGETRVNFFLTVTTAVLGALALRERPVVGREGQVDAIVYFLLLVVLLLGVATLGRLIHRNIKTDKMAYALGQMRKYFCARYPVESYLTWKSDHVPDRALLRPADLIAPRKGGLVETVLLLNSFIVGAIASLGGAQISADLAGEPTGIQAVMARGGASGAVVGFALAWFLQALWVNRRYRASRDKRHA